MNSDKDIVITGISARLASHQNLDEFVEETRAGDSGGRECQTTLASNGRRGFTCDSAILKLFDRRALPSCSSQQEIALVELCYEAILDSGVNPEDVKGTRVGVFMGHTEGNSNAAEILSKLFAFHGPALNTECTNGLAPLTQALNALKGGSCEGALVGSCFQESEAAVMYIKVDSDPLRRRYARILNVVSSLPRENLSCPDPEVRLVITCDSTDDIEQLIKLYTFERGVLQSQPFIVCASIQGKRDHSLVELVKAVYAVHRGTIPFTSAEKIENWGESLAFALREGALWLFADADAQLILNSSASNAKNQVLSHILPVLVPFSGNTRNNVQYALERLSGGKRDDEVIALAQEIATRSINGLYWRGYALINNANGLQVDRQVARVQQTKKPAPVWFVFGGMGTQWPACSQELIKFQVCRESFEKCAKALATVEFDLFKTMTEDSMKGEKEGSSSSSTSLLMNSMVSIVATQVALVDLLNSIGITPDGLVGQSMGQLGCAYADGCLSAQEAVLIAHAKAKALLTTPEIPQGSMAVIGWAWEVVQSQCPKDIYPAADNYTRNTTVSGSQAAMTEFLENLQDQGAVGIPIETHGIPFHTKLLEPARPKMLSYFKGILSQLRGRKSDRWKSTTIPEHMWGNWTELTAEYLVDNVMHPVLFSQALKYIPRDACVIEISPNSLLQQLLQRALPPTCVHVGLLSKTAGLEGVSAHLLQGVGKLFTAGLNPAIGRLYDSIQYPVSNQARSMSACVRWALR